MKCNNCGEILLEKDKFCSKCGTKASEITTTVTEPIKSIRNKTKPYWLIMLVPIILFILSTIFGFIVSTVTYEYELYMDPVYYLFDILNALRIITLVAFIVCTILTVFLYIKSSKKK